MIEEPKRDFAKIFDLNRGTLIKSMVDSMEIAMRSIQTGQDELKEIIANCKEQEFTPKETAAMKKIAQLRLKDKLADAKEQLAALNRISAAMDLDLFDWAGVDA
jgi:hypothetical protein